MTCIQKAYAKYEDALRAANALDFEDLILGVVRILEAPADGSMAVEVITAKEALQKKFDFILVDEFQDTNQIQYRLIKALGGPHAERLRRRRRRPVDLPVARRRRPQHPRLPQGLPRREGREARAELPLDEAHRARRRSP